MAEDKKVTKKVKKKVVEIINDLKADPSKRFSEGKYMKLLHGVLTDADHKAICHIFSLKQAKFPCRSIYYGKRSLPMRRS